MTTSFNSEQNFNELVFEKRNKEYGAYVIRRDYNDTVSRSLLITFGGICIIGIAAFLLNKGNLVAKITKGDLGTSITIVVDPNILNPPKDPNPPVQQKTTAPLPPKTDPVSGEVKDKPTDDNLKPNDQAVVGIGDPKGKPADSVQDVIPTIVVKKADPPVEVDPSRIVDEMPELKDLGRIIASNLNYPQIAKENGTGGTVYLSFVVEKDGSVTNVKVLQGVADGCTEEAMRVVKALPKWKPGKNHGEPVRVLFNLPIKFRLQ
ncbi:MAG: TonB family protein [Bacteroidetes bacterium]|nr:TonB family protein [Bacteroidota bacterium]